MAVHSPNGECVDSDSKILWEDGERVFLCGWRLEADAERRAVLFVVPAAAHSSRASLDHFSHEYE
jgi:hypothetical protein